MSGSITSASTSALTTAGTSGSDTYQPLYQAVKTLLGMTNDLELQLGLTPKYDTSTTLNTKYGVFQDMKPGTHPTLKYFGVGINGKRNIDTTNLSEPRQPLATNMDIYQPIPIRALPIENDLNTTDRASYRMRRVVTIGGQKFVLYYLKLITQTDSQVEYTKLNSSSGVQEAYQLDYTNLTPTPPTDTIDNVTTDVSAEINVLAATSFPLTGAEISEAINVLYKGDLRYANISEIGIYTGADASVQVKDYHDNNFTYTEAIMTQLDTHYCFNGNDMSSPTASFNQQFMFGSGKIALI